MANNLERLLGRFPDFYTKHGSGRLYGIMRAIDDELGYFVTEKGNLILSIQIDTAVGQELNDIGQLFLLTRRTGETDASYRARIKNARPSFTGGGTVDGLKSAFTASTGLPDTQITITDNFDLKFIAAITFYGASEIDFADEAIDAIYDSKAAGIYPMFSFTFDFQDDGVLCSDAVVITELSAFDAFIVEVSLLEETDVIQ